MRSILLCMLTSVLLSFSAVHAQDMQGMHDMSAHQHTQTYHAQGIVKNASPDALTIAHGAIPALNWPPMTMQFTRTEGSNSPAVKAGDKVSFSFVQGDEGYQIVSLTPVE